MSPQDAGSDGQEEIDTKAAYIADTILRMLAQSKLDGRDSKDTVRAALAVQLLVCTRFLPPSLSPSLPPYLPTSLPTSLPTCLLPVIN